MDGAVGLHSKTHWKPVSLFFFLFLLNSIKPVGFFGMAPAPGVSLVLVPT